MKGKYQKFFEASQRRVGEQHGKLTQIHALSAPAKYPKAINQEAINQEIDAEIAKRSKYDEMWIALDGCRKEIVAGSVLMPLTAEDRAWNEANRRAVRIIETYIQRKGLFQ